MPKPGGLRANSAKVPSNRTASPGKTSARNVSRGGAPLGTEEFPWWFPAGLLVVTLIVYWPVLHYEFIWDDDTHITGNAALRSMHGLWDIWFKPGATCQYYPLTFTFFWISYHLWGLNPVGYHLLNILWHGTAAVLLWRVLCTLKVPGAWLAGALFALHPVCVMSVAWMTELKNTLSASLALASAWAYLRAAGLGEFETKDQRLDGRFYLLSLLLFLLALCAKTAVSFLPATLLLITWWQGRRLNWRSIWPLLPMLGVAVGMGLTTIYVERHSGGASGTSFNVPLSDRVLISGRSFWFYLGKLCFPYPLTFLYERWHLDTSNWWQDFFPLATVVFLGVLWGLRRRIGRGLFVAALHFYVSTSLLILLVVLYMTRYTFVSDHWQYFGCMSVLTVVAAGITKTLKTLGGSRPWLAPVVYGALLLALGGLTWRQTAIYQNSGVLWTNTLASNPDSWMAHNNLGQYLSSERDWDDALEQFQEAVKLDPQDASSQNDLGVALARKGDYEEAIQHYTAAVKDDATFAEAENGIGLAYSKTGRLDEAIKHFQEALRINPALYGADMNMGNVLERQGKLDRAAACFRSAAEIGVDDPEPLRRLGNVLAASGHPDEAAAAYRNAKLISDANSVTQ